MTLRATDASELILRTCIRGAKYGEVVSVISRKWPAAPETLVRSTLLDMISAGFIATDLLPDESNDDPIAHILGKLPEACSLRGPLAQLRYHLREADRHAPGAPDRLKALIAARAQCDKVAYEERPIFVDVAADAHLVLPATLAEEAAEAAGLLWRVSHARATLADYHARFLSRYGPHRFVPLLDVTDPAIGLGDVDGEADIVVDPIPPGQMTVLADLLAGALANGHTEVLLDSGVIAAMDKHDIDLPPPPTAEIYVRVLAASAEDLAAGKLYLAAYPGGTQQAGSTVGRFSMLLPSPVSLPPAPDLRAEVAVRPRSPDLAAVAPPTGFAPIRIPVGMPARKGDLSLDDLLLVSDGERLMLWSSEHGQPVVPGLYSRIGPRYLPPVARLLGLLGMSGCRPWCGWSWGPLDHAPFLPRVRYKANHSVPCTMAAPVLLDHRVS